MKLRSLVAGAQLATRRFLELRSPVLCRSLTLESTPFQAAIFTSEDLLLRLQQKLPYIYIYIYTEFLSVLTRAVPVLTNWEVARIKQAFKYYADMDCTTRAAHFLE